jgi:hypothetical protein
MKIQELVEQQQLSELDVGQGISKAVGGVARGVGAVAGGIAGIPGAVKKGYQAGKAAVGGSDTTQPAAGTAPSGAAQSSPTTSNPVAIRDQIRQHQAAISQLRQQLTAPAADDQQDTEEPAAQSNSNVRPFVRTTPPTNTTPTTQPTSTAQPANQSPEEKRKADLAAAADVAQQDMAANPAPNQTTSTAAPQTPEEKRIAQQAAAAQTARDQMGPQGQPVAQPTTTPAPSGLGAVGDVRPGAPQPDPKAQQAALKARLQSGDTLSSRTSGKFKDSEVGAQRNKLITKPDGSSQMVPVREHKELYSRFLGRVL